MSLYEPAAKRSLPPRRRRYNGPSEDGYRNIADSQISAAQADMSRIARRGRKIINRKLGAGGLPAIVRLLLAVVFVTVLAALDFPLFEWLFGNTPFWTWTTAAGTNGMLIVVCHFGLAKAVYDISRAGPFGRGLKWRIEVFAAVFIAFMALACSTAASWARATALGAEGAAVLGVRSPGVGVAFMFFVGLHGALFGVGTLTGIQELKHRWATENEYVLPVPLLIEVCGLAEEYLQRLFEIAAECNSVIASNAVHYPGPVPSALPRCSVPEELKADFEAIKDAYGWAADEELA